MGQVLKIIIVLSACYFAAYFILSKLTPHKENLRKYLVASLIIIATTALTKSILFGYLVTFLVSLHYGSRSTPSERVALFFGIAFTLPDTNGVALNPGLDLGYLDYRAILTFSLLLPMLFTQAKEKEVRRLNAIDKAVIFYVVWMILVNFRMPSFTSMLRGDVWLVLDIIVPYLAIRYFSKDYTLIFAALSFALFAQSAVGILESVLRWHIYTDFQLISGFAEAFYTMYKYRWGFLRVQGSFMNPLIYALFANMSFLCAVVYLTKLGINYTTSSSKKFAWISLIVTTLGMLAPVSRGAFAGSAIVVIIAVVILWACNRERDPKNIILFWGAVFGLCLIVFAGDFIRQNFQYRVRLFEIATGVILESPVFGYIAPHEEDAMRELVQGEGIVDLVNTYLIVPLFYGLPALFLFCFAIVTCLSRLYSSIRQSKNEIRMIGVFAFVTTSVIAFNLISTSNIGWTGAWLWMALALGSNIVARVDSQTKSPEKQIQ